MDRISSVLGDVIRNLGLGKRLEKEQLVQLWDEVVGEKISKNAWATDCRGSTLLVETRNSTWLQELSLMKYDLVKKLNNAAGKQVVDNIIFFLEKR